MFGIIFDKSSDGQPRMVLTKKSGKDFLAAVIERPVPASTSNGSVPSHTVDDYPGIPMSEQDLSDLTNKELRRVEVNFWGEAGQFPIMPALLIVADIYDCRPETV